MPIDTALKRRSAVATRRLPWFRRFLPAPDATIDQGDRQQLAFVYRGILAAAPVAPTAPSGPGIELSSSARRLHYTTDRQPFHLSTEERRFHLSTERE